MKYHLSMSSKLGFRVPRWNRNDTFFACICKYFVVFWPSSGGSMSETVLLMRPSWWLTGQVGPPPPPLRGRPHLLTAGRGAAAPGPASTVSGNVSHCRGHVRGKKQQSFCKNVSFLFHRGTRNPSLEDMERWYFTLRSNFPTTMSRLFANRAKAAE